MIIYTWQILQIMDPGSADALAGPAGEEVANQLAGALHGSAFPPPGADRMLARW